MSGKTMKSSALKLTNEFEALLRKRVRRFCGGCTPVEDALFLQRIENKEIGAIWCAGEIDGSGNEVCDVLCMVIPRKKILGREQ